jgi:hypothetical protein
MSNKKDQKTVADILGAAVIMPEKDFEICFPPRYHIIITKGVEVTIPQMFLQNLVTEKVITEAAMTKAIKSAGGK